MSFTIINLISLNHGKWIFYIDNIYKHDYDHVILTNDNFLIIDTIIPFIELHLSDNYEMTEWYPREGVALLRL